MRLEKGKNGPVHCVGNSDAAGSSFAHLSFLYEILMQGDYS